MSFFGLNEPIFPGHERLTIGAAPLMFFIWRFVCDCRHFCWKPRAGRLSSPWKGRVTAHLEAKQGEVRERERHRKSERKMTLPVYHKQSLISWSSPKPPPLFHLPLLLQKAHTQTHQDIKQAHWFGVYNYQMAGSLKGTPVRVHVCACVCRWRGLINMSLTKGDADQRGSRWARCVCARCLSTSYCADIPRWPISAMLQSERERAKETERQSKDQDN